MEKDIWKYPHIFLILNFLAQQLYNAVLQMHFRYNSRVFFETVNTFY